MKNLFISDIHFGDSTLTKQKQLLQLLDDKYEHVYLVGDIFDIWKVPFEEALKIAEPFLLALKSQKNVTYIYGNHDIDISILSSINGITIVEELQLEIAGKKFLVLHGHQWDKWFKEKYELSRLIVKLQGFLDRTFGTHWQQWLTKWSLATRSKKYFLMIEEHKEFAISYAAKHKCDGVIVGHSHAPEISYEDGLYYLNTGDSVSLHHTCIIQKDDLFILRDYATNESIDFIQVK